eukprot:GILK01010252.1.p1 GENE.GILK01010252.1~~GILK01010252.1.p1  ORF type:complete len:148 (-),score=9.83 GILK01010252.1:217-660(-)
MEESSQRTHRSRQGYSFPRPISRPSASPSTVNVRSAELRKLGYRSLKHWLEADESHVYVGRDMTRYVEGAVGSKWQNPFKERDGSLDERLRLYEAHVRNSSLIKDIMELDGKKLGCWCTPAPCHCDVLHRLVHERKVQDTKQAPSST